MMVTGLADVLRKAGLDVVELPGWKQLGHGGMEAVHGITLHHTASGRGTGTTLGLATVRDGRPGLEGPLAQLYLNRAGTVYVVAAGLCYHAGDSLKADYTNRYRIGMEMLAAGDGWSHDWPSTQTDAAVIVADALSQHYQFDLSEVRGHKETCLPVGRKIDPSFDMVVFRETVVARRKARIQEAKMNWNDARKLTETDAECYGGGKQEGDDSSWSVAVRYPPATARLRTEVNERLDRIEKGQAEILRLLADLAGNKAP